MAHSATFPLFQSEPAAGRALQIIRLWRWLPVLWLLACAWYITESFSLAAPYVAVPLAAYLGFHYGRSALPVVALGILPQVLTIRMSALLIGGNIDVALLALACCHLGASRRSWHDDIPALPTTLGFYVALAGLPLAVSWYGTDVAGARVAVATDFSALLYVLLFAAGMLRVPPRRVFPVLVIATAMGMACDALATATDARSLLGAERAHVPGLGLVSLRDVWVNYYLDRPAALLAAALYYGTGTIFRRMLDTKQSVFPRWYWALAVVLGVSVLAMAWGIDAATTGKWIGVRHVNYWRVFGDSYALIVASVLAGLLLRGRGVVVAASLLVVLWVLNPAFSRGADTFVEWLESLFESRFSASLGDLVTVVVFGFVGIRMRKAALPHEPRVRLWPWLALAASTLFLLGEWTLPEPVESPRDLVPLIVAVTAVVIIVTALATWRRRWIGVNARFHAGWIALLALIALVQLLLENLSSVRDVAREIAAVGVFSWLVRNESEWIPLIVVAVAAYLWGVLTAARTFFRDAREWWRDLLQAAHVLATLARRGIWAARLEQRIPAKLAEGELAPAGTWQARVVRILDRTRVVVAAIGVIGAAIEVIPSLRELEWVDELWPRSRHTAEPGLRPPAEAPVLADPKLWRAAFDQMAWTPLDETNPLGMPAIIRSQWQVDPQANVRRSVTLQVFAPSRWQAVDVQVVRQRYWKAGIWLEGISALDALSSKERQKISDEIKKRAAEFDRSRDASDTRPSAISSAVPAGLPPATP